MKSLHLNSTAGLTYMTKEDAVALPRTYEGLFLLCEFLSLNPLSDSAWQTLFFDFDHLLGKSEREKMVGVMREELEPEMIRLILGECISVDEFFSEEKAKLESIPKSTAGVQQLVEYLKHNINCFYGWDIYFDRYYSVSTPEQQRDAKQILKNTYDECFLRLRFPSVFV